MNRKKRDALNKELEEMDRNMINGRIREGYRGIKKIKNGYRARSKIMKDANGSITVQEDKVLEIWKNYFCELLNRGDPVNPTEGRHMQVPNLKVEEPILIDEKNAIISLKNNKAPGLDNIPAELLENDGEMLHSKIFELTIMIWRTEENPTTWETGNIIPGCKEGDKTDYANYRGIAFLPTCFAAVRVGLEISESKTKMMRTSKDNQQQRQQQNMVDIEDVEEFKYLGSMLTS
ncbi:uncharacterized protein [Macrobrachium rosenbergii]|uniref:uncharacterized protein n=1 Tax=Macrobrachium rosenbergii TaxID=79674 RepID=UPI0034D651E9